MHDQKNLSTWMRVIVIGWKDHYCHVSMLSDIVQDAFMRGHDLLDAQSIDQGMIDAPGIAKEDRKYANVPIDAFSIEIPVIDFESFLSVVKSSPERKFVSGKSYYKIHGSSTCLVLTSEQRIEMLSAMEAMVADVKKDADKEIDEMTNAIDDMYNNGINVLSKHDRKLPERMKNFKIGGVTLPDTRYKN